jgi:cytochrome c oxidase subunit 2
MSKVLLNCLLTAITAMSALTALAAGDPVKGKELFQICAACHGQNGEGNAILNAPINAGQNEWYVVRQLKNFRAGIRGADPQDTFGMQMRPMAMTLADEQAIQDVAAYVTSLTPPTPAKTVTGDIEAGKKAFVPCMPCHGEKAEGARSLNAPALAHQFDWYLVRQLKNFQAGIRGKHTRDIYGSQMQPMSQLLATDEQINNVAAYIASLE